MSTNENKYINGKIYKISSPSTNGVYIGSTCSLLRSRLNKHIIDYNQYILQQRSYISSFEIVK